MVLSSLELRTDLDDRWLGCRAAWPGVEVSAEDFAAYVAERLPDPSVTAQTLNLVDLYLACACAGGQAAALHTFDRVLLAQVPRFLARIACGDTLTDDVKQLLRERLFMGGPDGVPKICSYQGRGPLCAWLRTAAIHAAFRLLRERKADLGVPLDERDFVDDGADPVLELIKASHREAFEHALREAMANLSTRERSLLRHHLVSGVTTHKLAAMYRVNQSTIVRALAAAREQVRAATLARLTERLRISTAELESLAGLLLSRLDLSLASCLHD